MIITVRRPPAVPTRGPRLPPEGPTPPDPIPLAAGRGRVIWAVPGYLFRTGSVKGLVARHMLTEARARGDLPPGRPAVVCTSGSTGAGVADAALALRCPAVVVMPAGVNPAAAAMARLLGAEVLVSPAAEGVAGAGRLAARVAAALGGYEVRQFDSPDNPAAFRRHLVPHLLARIPGGRVDAVVSGVGTGGTLVGLTLGFRAAGHRTLAVAARPVTAAGSFSQRVPGVADGASGLLGLLDPGPVVVDVREGCAMEAARRLIRAGVPAGPSSGLNLAAARIAARRLPPGAQVVTVFPDTAWRHVDALQA